MAPLVRKKDGTFDKFQPAKIAVAAAKAMLAVGHDETEAMEVGSKLADLIAADLNNRNEVDYNEIHDLVQLQLMDFNKYAATAYILYRQNRRQARAGRDALIEAFKSISQEISKDNANIHNSPSSKMYEFGSEANKHYVFNYLLPKDIADAHLTGDIHIHDANYYQLTYNCLAYDLAGLLDRGFQMPHGFIRPPKSIMAAAALTAVTMQSVQNDQYGGVGVDRIDEALAPWADKSTDREIHQAMEALIFNLNSLHARAGNQVPFTSISFGLGTTEGARKITKSILEVYDAGLGKGEMPMFPNMSFKVKSGVNFEEGTPNHDLLLQALKVSSRRMNPTYIFVDSTFNAPYGDEAFYMGCRTRVIANRRGPEVTAGRGNLAFVSINLPRIALRTKSDKEFFSELDKVLRICERQLIHRWDIIKKLKVKDIPFVMGERIYLGAEGLRPEDPIENALANGTLTIGFIGLAETLVALRGKHHAEDQGSQELGLKIVSHLRDYCDKCSEKHNLNFSLIATPAEGLSGRFIKYDKKQFGEIPGITDKDHYTNSFHVPVGFDITIDNKIKTEGPYHKFCNAGHISYIELGSPPLGNVDGLYAVLKFMKENDMGYVGFNYPIDFCNDCALMGVISEACPKCASTNIRRVRRVTGYFSTEENIGVGKADEIKRRKAHAGKLREGS